MDRDYGVDGTVILKWILKKWDGETDWIDLAKDGAGRGSSLMR
jgi:hypothetical protein